MDLIKILEENYTKKKVPQIKPGDTVRVSQKIREAGKERIQIFEGIVIKEKGTGISKTITVRRIASGVGVERTYPIHSPSIQRIEVVKRSKVRRANLSYLRKLRGKAAKLTEKEFDRLLVNITEDTEPPLVATEAQKETADNTKETTKSKEKEKSKGEKIDKEVTEINVEEAEDVKPEESLKEVAKEEEKEEKIEKEEINISDESKVEQEEIEEGLEKAENEDTKDQDKEQK